MHTFASPRGLLALPLLLAGCAPAIGGVLLATSGGGSSGGGGPSLAMEAEWTFPPARAVAAGDIDGDDDIDLVFTSASDLLHVYENTGTRRAPVYTETNAFGQSGHGEALYLVDLDKDSDLDLIVVPGTRGVDVWLNDGSANFTDTGQFFTFTSPPQFGSSPHTAVVADVDGDGAPDIVTGDVLGFHVWLNDGAGAFSHSGAVMASSERVIQLIAADLDDDGDQDIVQTNYIGQVFVWQNGGSGTFVVVASLSFAEGEVRVAIGDIDRDGYPDLIGHSGSLSYAINDRAGGFGPTYIVALDRTTTFATGDFDRDGNLDVFTAHYGVDRVYLNLGRPAFVQAALLPYILPYNPVVQSADAGQLVVIDVNADGKPDIVEAILDDGVGMGTRSRILRNRHGEQ